MGQSEPDPMQGAFRWAWARGKKRLNSFLVGGVLLGGLVAVLSNLLVAPHNATQSQRVLYSLAPLAGAVLIAVAAAFGWSFLRAPYEQREALHLVVYEYSSKAKRLEDHRFQKHLEDQQDFAKTAMEYIYPETRMGRGEGWMPFPYTPSDIEALQVHFPEAASALKEWSETATAYQAAVPELGKRLEDIARAMGCDFTGNGLTGLLEFIAKDWGSVTEVTFRVSDGRLMADIGKGRAGYTIGSVKSPDEADALRDRVLAVMHDVPGLVEATTRRRLLYALSDLRPRAYDTLSKASKTYDLVGTCATCPPMIDAMRANQKERPA